MDPALSVPLPADHDLAEEEPPEAAPGAAGVMPDLDEWARLSPARREQALQAALDDLAAREEEELQFMAEGDPHGDACQGMRDTLRAFFRHRGASIYVGANIPVCYPGRKAFSPDVVVATEVPVRPREAWVVADEGKGLDLVVEVHHKGSWRKDFVDNVQKYAQLGIREYFIFDVNRMTLAGLRLPPGKHRYDTLRSSRGRLHSEVLGLDLAVDEGQVRFYLGTARLLTSPEREEEIARRAEQEQQRADQAQQRAEQEQQRAEQAMQQLRRTRIEAILALLRSQGADTGAATRARLAACEDPDQLERWFQRALTGTVEIWDP
jgi:Uma2 family endonuclease